MLRGPMTEASTQRASPRRLAQGGKPMSRALLGAAALIALGLALDLRASAARLRPSLLGALAAAREPSPRWESIVHGWRDGALGLAAVLGPLLGSIVVAVLVAAVLQSAPLGKAAARSESRTSRFDLGARAQQLLAPERALDALASAVFLVVLGAVAWLTLAPNVRGLLALSGADPDVAAPQLIELGQTLLWRLAVTGCALGAADYAQRRVRHMLSLRMTRRELLEEQREQYGDPAVRAERARRRRAQAGSRAGS